MPWLPLVAYVFGGVFLANAAPHLVAGVMGQSFQSPFARPPGEGRSSSTVNVLWGFLNLGLGYLLVSRVGAFNPRDLVQVAALAAGALAISLFAARHFGRFNGGADVGQGR